MAAVARQVLPKWLVLPVGGLVFELHHAAFVRLSIALLPLALVMACADSSEKGDEDNPLGDGKTDSFFEPTLHGELQFGAPNVGELTADEQFHAWTFELSDDASLTLETEISSNLDTVMYLYRRELGSTGSWGRFKRKNDDFEGELFSRIEHDGDAAEYQVIVKGFKEAMRGEFRLHGECLGAGCPGAGTCDGDTFPALTGETDFSAGCAHALIGVFAGEVESTAVTESSEDDLCGLSMDLRSDVDAFRGYWDDVVGWDDFADTSSGDPLHFEIESRVAGDHRISLIDTSQLDEDAITFYYGVSDELLMLFQHNQSPDVRFFCKKPSEATISTPSCIEDARLALEHEAGDIVDEGTLTSSCDQSLSGSLPLLVGDPICEFTFKHGIADQEPVEVSFQTWNSRAGLLGAAIQLEADGVTETYYIGTTHSITTDIFAVRGDAGTEFICLELS